MLLGLLLKEGYYGQLDGLPLFRGLMEKGSGPTPEVLHGVNGLHYLSLYGEGTAHYCEIIPHYSETLK